MKSIQLLAVTVLFTAFNFAQTEATWQIELENDVEWQKVTSSGYLLVASANSMYSLNQDNGAIIWENKELVGYNEDQIQEVNNSPLFMSKKDGHVRFFSPFDGAIKFDSRKQGFSEFKSATFLPRTGGLLVSGKVDGNDQLVMVDVNDGAKRWSLDEKIGRIISVNEQNKSEFIVTTLFFVYKINSSTGNIVWKNSVSPDRKSVV
jgi:outer membrane protein assembly factor BamB